MSEARTIDNDPVTAVIGGSLFSGRDDQLTSYATTYITRIPLEPAKPGEIPRESMVGISHQMMIGTVQQIVDKFKEQLTTSYYAFVEGGRPHGLMPELPMTDEVEIRMPASAEALEAHDLGGRYVPGRTYRQSAVVRDQLKNLCWAWGHSRRNAGYSDDIDGLIEALKVYREDNAPVLTANS